MAGEILVSNLTSGLGSTVAEAFSQIPGMSAIIKIAQTAGVLFIVYILFLIFKSIIQTRQSMRLKQIANSVEEINKKLDILVGKKGAAKKEK